MTDFAPLTIRVDTASDPQVIALLQAHLDTMYATSPPESVFALDLDGLRTPDVTFWTMWDGEQVVACGALRELSPAHGEVKSMHTKADFRGRGAGAQMLEHILTEASRRGYERLSLETGSHEAFMPAQRLYQRNGFSYCDAFAPYEPNPFSVFMTRVLAD